MTDDIDLEKEPDDGFVGTIEEEPERHIAWFVSTVTGEYYFRIKADNGETIAGSEGYTRKDDMMDTLDEYFGDWNLVEDDV
jgi:hypothetical protein